MLALHVVNRSVKGLLVAFKITAARDHADSKAYDSISIAAMPVYCLLISDAPAASEIHHTPFNWKPNITDPLT